MKCVIYIHGKGGKAAEAEHYRPLFPDCAVIGLEYKSQTPWESKEEFPKLFDFASTGYESVILVANSIGTYFSMLSLMDKKIEKAFFISPVVDMPKLISAMMHLAGVTPGQLREKGNIKTNFGETLSWEYFSYARNHPIDWQAPTYILYGSKDFMTSPETIRSFSEEFGAVLTVMDGGEHWFHTEEQMAFLDRWITSACKGD